MPKRLDEKMPVIRAAFYRNENSRPVLAREIVVRDAHGIIPVEAVCAGAIDCATDRIGDPFLLPAAIDETTRDPVRETRAEFTWNGSVGGNSTYALAE